MELLPGHSAAAGLVPFRQWYHSGIDERHWSQC